MLTMRRMWERDHSKFYQAQDINEQRRRLQGFTIGEREHV
jgi:hypothetical protein